MRKGYQGIISFILVLVLLTGQIPFNSNTVLNEQVYANLNQEDPENSSGEEEEDGNESEEPDEKGENEEEEGEEDTEDNSKDDDQDQDKEQDQDEDQKNNEQEENDEDEEDGVDHNDDIDDDENEFDIITDEEADQGESEEEMFSVASESVIFMMIDGIINNYPILNNKREIHIESIEFTDEDNVPFEIEDGKIVGVGLYDNFKIRIKVNLDDDAEPYDYMVIKIPEEFVLPFHFEEKTIIAKIEGTDEEIELLYITYDDEEKEIYFIYGDGYTEDLYESEAEIYFTAAFNLEVVDDDDGDEVEVDFGGDDGSFTIVLKENDPSISVSKEGKIFEETDVEGYSAEGKHIIHWDINTYISQGKGYDPVITDIMPKGLEYVHHELEVNYYADDDKNDLEASYWSYELDTDEDGSNLISFVYDNHTDKNYIPSGYNVSITLYTEITDYNKFINLEDISDGSFAVPNDIEFLVYKNGDKDEEKIVFTQNSSLVQVIINLLSKEGVQGSGANATVLTWTIFLNPDEHWSIPKAVLEDIIPKGLTFDKTTVKVYTDFTEDNKGKYVVSGSPISDTRTIFSKIKVHNTDQDTGTTKVEFFFKDTLDKKYAVQYQTYIDNPDFGNTNNTATYTNQARVYSRKKGHTWIGDYTVEKGLLAKSTLLAKGGTRRGEYVDWSITLNGDQNINFDELNAFTLYSILDDPEKFEYVSGSFRIDISDTEASARDPYNGYYKESLYFDPDSNLGEPAPVEFAYMLDMEEVTESKVPSFKVDFDHLDSETTLYIKYTVRIIDMELLLSNNEVTENESYHTIGYAFITHEDNNSKLKPTGVRRSVEIPSSIIEKSNNTVDGSDRSFKYDYATKTASWAINLNKYGIDLSDYTVTLTDILPETAQEVIIVGDEEDIPDDIQPGSHYMTFTEVQIYDDTDNVTEQYENNISIIDDKNLTIVFDDLDENLMIEIITKVDDAAFNKTGTLYFDNTIEFEAVLTSAQRQRNILDNDGPFTASDSDNFHIINEVMVKEGLYTEGNAFIDWQIDLNKNASKYLDYSGKVLIDEFSDGLMLDIYSVKLSRYSVITKKTDAGEIRDIELEESYTLDEGGLTYDNIEYDFSQNLFRFTFPENLPVGYMYRLDYTTDIISESEGLVYENDARFDDQNLGGSGSLVTANFGVGGFGSAKRRSASVELRIYKYDVEDMEIPLQSAEFTVTDENGSELFVGTTNEEGFLTVALTGGHVYTLTETAVPQGYYLIDGVDSWEIDLREFKQLPADDESGVYYYEAEIANTTEEPPVEPPVEPPIDPPIPPVEPPVNPDPDPDPDPKPDPRGQIKVLKLGEENEKLAGAVFKLIDADTGEEWISEPTDAQGITTFKNIPYGIYILEEIQAPDGYIMTDETFRISVGSTLNKVEITVFNSKDKGEVTLIKTDAQSGEFLRDALFSITDENGNTVYEGVTDEEGIIRLFLPLGTYFVREIEAPKGYVLDDSPIEFTVKEINEILQIEITNHKERYPSPEEPETPSEPNGFDPEDPDPANPDPNPDPQNTDDYESQDSDHRSMPDDDDDYEVIQWGIGSDEGKTNPKTGQSSITARAGTIFYGVILLCAYAVFVLKKMKSIKKLS